MLALPISSSPLRSLFDVAHLAEIAHPANRAKLRTFRDAVNSAREQFSSDSFIKAVCAICVCADGTLRLVRVGSKGSIKRLWNFGPI